MRILDNLRLKERFCSAIEAFIDPPKPAPVVPDTAKMKTSEIKDPSTYQIEKNAGEWVVIKKDRNAIVHTLADGRRNTVSETITEDLLNLDRLKRLIEYGRIAGDVDPAMWKIYEELQQKVAEDSPERPSPDYAITENIVH